MARDISRVLIETVVRKMLREAKDSPERSIRNLVDMALYFSDGGTCWPTWMRTDSWISVW